MSRSPKYPHTRRLVTLALESGHTQKELAALCRVAQSQVSAWKNGERTASVAQLEPLLDLYGDQLQRLPGAVYLIRRPPPVPFDETPVGRWMADWEDRQRQLEATHERELAEWESEMEAWRAKQPPRTPNSHRSAFWPQGTSAGQTVVTQPELLESPAPSSIAPPRPKSPAADLPARIADSLEELDQEGLDPNQRALLSVLKDNLEVRNQLSPRSSLEKLRRLFRVDHESGPLCDTPVHVRGPIVWSYTAEIPSTDERESATGAFRRWFGVRRWVLHKVGRGRYALADLRRRTHSEIWRKPPPSAPYRGNRPSRPEAPSTLPASLQAPVHTREEAARWSGALHGPWSIQQVLAFIDAAAAEESRDTATTAPFLLRRALVHRGISVPGLEVFNTQHKPPSTNQSQPTT